MYNKRVWLNPPDSPSTGSVVAYHGPANWGKDTEPQDESFFEVADCHSKARIHRCKFDNMEDFINKLERLSQEAQAFAEHLKLANEKTDE